MKEIFPAKIAQIIAAEVLQLTKTPQAKTEHIMNW